MAVLYIFVSVAGDQESFGCLLRGHLKKMKPMAFLRLGIHELFANAEV
jgi:hypothetical protein